jgi:hypothetical protein
MLQFSFYQDATSLDFELQNSDLKNSEIQGTVLNHLFRWVRVQKVMGAKGLKFSQPINIRIIRDGIQVADTGTAKIQLQQRLKLNATAEKCRKFAVRFCTLVEFINSGIEVVDIDTALELIEVNLPQ